MLRQYPGAVRVELGVICGGEMAQRPSRGSVLRCYERKGRLSRRREWKRADNGAEWTLAVTRLRHYGYESQCYYDVNDNANDIINITICIVVTINSNIALAMIILSVVNHFWCCCSI